MKILAVEIGGSHATCALVEGRSILDSTTLNLAASKSLGPVLDHLSESIRGLLRRNTVITKECGGIAVSYCNVVDSRAGRILSTFKFPDGPQMDLPAWAEAQFGLPLRLENDARMALLGERYAGAARGADDVVMVTLGTGIGAAAMVEARLLRGKSFQICLGSHIPVVLGGRKCVCGNLGCVEAEASGWALPAICREWPGFEQSQLSGEKTLDFEALFCSAAAGDGVACEIRDRCLRVWAAGAVALIHAYDPEVVVFGGGVMKSRAQILPYIQCYVDKHSWSAGAKPRVVAAELGNDAPLLGAIPLIREAE